MPDVLEVTVEEKVEQAPRYVPGFLERREGRVIAASVLAALALGTVAYGYFYMKFARVVDRRLAAGAFSQTTNIYSAPRSLAVGDAFTPEEIARRLRRSGYTTSHTNSMGWYELQPNAIEIFPGRDSYFNGEAGRLEFANGKISRIASLRDHTDRTAFQLEPQLIANLSQQREKRRLVRFADIPPSLIHALVSIEDKHFFEHSGFDLPRMVKAAYVDLKDGRKDQGASTLTMQLARGFWLEPEKRWKRKIEEILLTMHLEERLSKQQIFEYYANQVYLGRRGTFIISGFGEGAHAYFGKELTQLSNAEAAMLAGLVQRPSYYNPFRYPERIRERRNMVLASMRQNGYLTDEEYRTAAGSSIALTAEQSEGNESQYFVDLMNDELQNTLDDRAKATRSIYTTLDSDLQVAAQEAVRMGMQNVDQQLRKKKGKPAIPAGQPQVALIALDPHTGEIKALVGGRNYGESQLNHVLSMRQPGSVFKPFVYAAALDTAVEGGPKLFTPATVVSDEPTSFAGAEQVYTPHNFGYEFMGDVTLRTALAHSLNVATVELAEQVGYRKVVAMARRAGLNDAIKPTPAVALGSYETTPLEIAGAYTMFANQGMHVSPTTISMVRAPGGHALYRHEAQPHPALDARVAYLMVSMMQEVLRSGTGAGVRSHGFALPAAGKTGTSRDGWFAGFTSQLLCVVWVGFDDNRDLNLEGARSALPIWAEFMKRAAQLRPYRDAKNFQSPAGVLTTQICSDSGELAGAHCTNVRFESFINGTQPVVECEMHGLPTQQSTADRVVELPEHEGSPTTAHQ